MPTTTITFGGQRAQSDLNVLQLSNYLHIESKAYYFNVKERPHYCDRGRYCVDAIFKSVLWNPFDDADGFPRYYFSLQRCLDEIKDLIEFRESKMIAEGIDFSAPPNNTTSPHTFIPPHTKFI